LAPGLDGGAQAAHQLLRWRRRHLRHAAAGQLVLPLPPPPPPPGGLRAAGLGPPRWVSPPPTPPLDQRGPAPASPAGARARAARAAEGVVRPLHHAVRAAHVVIERREREARRRGYLPRPKAVGAGPGAGGGAAGRRLHRVRVAARHGPRRVDQAVALVVEGAE